MQPLLAFVQTADRLLNQIQQNVAAALRSYPLLSQAAKGLVASAGQLLGTNTSDTAAAGNVGEVKVAQLVFASAAALAAVGTAKTLASFTLTPGDWDVSVMVDFSLTGTTVTAFQIGLSTTTNAIPAGGTMLAPDSSGQIRSDLTVLSSVAGATGDLPMTIPSYRISLSVPTTLYLVAACVSSAGSVAASGLAKARRAR